MNPWLRGQLFLFDGPRARAFTAVEGWRALAIFIAIEIIVRPLVFAADARWVSSVNRDWLAVVELSLLTAIGLWLTVNFARIQLSQIGLRSWPNWSDSEKYYLVEIVPITVAVFSFFDFPSIQALWMHPNLWIFALVVIVQKGVWGFYQEFFYRALLQTELVRRWGVVPGILAGNLIFTFGPLHAYHFAAALRHPANLWIFAAIFAIGLFFGILYERSRNLWIVGGLHGLGDWFIDGLPQVVGL